MLYKSHDCSSAYIIRMIEHDLKGEKQKIGMEGKVQRLPNVHILMDVIMSHLLMELTAGSKYQVVSKQLLP